MYSGSPLKIWFFTGSPHRRAYIWDHYIGKVFIQATNSILVGNTSVGGNPIFFQFFSILMSWGSAVLDFMGGLILVICPSGLKVRVTVLLLFGFHLWNSIFFDIGTFPYLMMFSMILWIPLSSSSINTSIWSSLVVMWRKKDSGRLMCLFVLLLVLIQVLIPLRCFVLTEDVNWTKDGHYFAWRMMINQEDTLTRWEAFDESSGSEYWITSRNSPHLSLIDHQRYQMGHDPGMISQFAFDYVFPLAVEEFHCNPLHTQVFVTSWRALNNRPFQRWIRSDLNLLSPYYSSSWSHSSWITERIIELEDKTLTSSMANTRRFWNSNGFEIVLFADKEGEVFSFSFLPFASDLKLVFVAGQMDISSHSEDIHVSCDSVKCSHSFLSIKPKELISITCNSPFSVFGFVYTNASLSFAKAIDM